MHASRTRAKVALMPELAFPGDLPVRLDDGQFQARIRALVRIVHGKTRPTTRAQIGDVARWCGVTVRAVHNLEERGLTQSERGPNGVRFFDSEQQTRIEVALALRELGASLQDTRAFLNLLAGDRREARAFLKTFLDRRSGFLQQRMDQISGTLVLLESDHLL